LQNLVAVALLVEFPVDYPSVVPIIGIDVEKGLGKKHSDELRVIALEHAESNVGGPSIFVIAEAIKDWLMDNNNPGQDGSMYAEMMRRVQQKDAVEKKKVDKAAISAAADSEMRAEIIDPAEQERIRKRQAGTQVTLETFISWKIKFDDEMKAAAEAGKKGAAVEVDDRPTGRQLFQTNRVGTDDEEAMLAAAEVDQAEEFSHKVENNIEDDDDDDDEDYVEGDDDESDEDEA
jgi:DRG Family Regulatory Proteins, Tma46/RWD domain